jgi:hypothetical protein
MYGLFFSEVILFGVAGLLGLGAGWRLYMAMAAQRRDDAARQTEQLRAALTEAQVRRARVA